MPVVTLPDGSLRSFDKPVSVYDVAADIGPGLAKAALAGKVDGRDVDTSYVIEGDALFFFLNIQKAPQQSRHCCAVGVGDFFKINKNIFGI